MKLAGLIAVICVALPASAEVVVRDDFGHMLQLRGPAQRVVSFAPHLTELVYAIGAGKALVGAIAHSDYPDAARALPRIGTAAAIDLEAVLALAPDLIVAWPQTGHRRALERLVGLGIPVYRSEPRALEDIPQTLERLGTLTGRDRGAGEAAAAFDARLARLRERYAGRPSVRVFYQFWDRPLMTVNGDHLITKVMRVCGGENVFAGLPGLAPEIDRESVLAANPEVIIASGPDASEPGWLRAWMRFPQLAAAARGELHAIAPDLIQRHTPRILEGTERVCEILETARTRRAASRPGRETAR